MRSNVCNLICINTGETRQIANFRRYDNTSYPQVQDKEERYGWNINILNGEETQEKIYDVLLLKSMAR